MYFQVHDLVDQRRNEVVALCRGFRVVRLSVFGSLANGGFNTETSDLDFLVKFADRRPDGDYADRFLGLADGLEQLFDRHVDLVTEESLRRPRFRAEVESTKKVVYEAENPVVVG
jgi:predicted nucleotidyltransferase